MIEVVYCCNFCEKTATKFVVGWVDGGPGEDGYGVQPVCDEHVKPFQEWVDNDEEHESDEIHGFSYITGIVNSFEEAQRI